MAYKVGSAKTEATVYSGTHYKTGKSTSGCFCACHQILMSSACVSYTKIISRYCWLILNIDIYTWQWCETKMAQRGINWKKLREAGHMSHDLTNITNYFGTFWNLCMVQYCTRFRCCAMCQKKHPRGSPTFITPIRPLKRLPLRVQSSPHTCPYTRWRIRY